VQHGMAKLIAQLKNTDKESGEGPLDNQNGGVGVVVPKKKTSRSGKGITGRRRLGKYQEGSYRKGNAREENSGGGLSAQEQIALVPRPAMDRGGSRCGRRLCENRSPRVQRGTQSTLAMLESRKKSDDLCRFQIIDDVKPDLTSLKVFAGNRMRRGGHGRRNKRLTAD